jgi:rRNA pseudouridine-1189 N-methylase Emg1 (Nep1/Mra1 family)
VERRAREVYRRKPRGLRAAVIVVLGDAKKPLSPKEIWDEVSRRKLHRSHGKTPEATVSAMLYRRTYEFEKAGPGRFRLKRGR